MPHPLADTTARAPDATLAGLTSEQAQAVCHGPGPLLIYAGPGAGKTRTLTHRIARLLATGAAAAWQILAVTFSVRAADELRLRLADLLGEQTARGVTATTFHSVCARILRDHAGLFGRTAQYTIYDQTDVRRVIEWLLSDRARTDIQQALADHGQPAAVEVASEISLAKNRLLSVDSYEHGARHPATTVIAATWRQLEAELARCNAFDFDSLLVAAVHMLAEHPHRLAFYRQRWRWLLCDEYQDTNPAQGALLALLAGPDGNICCVGDDDQSLYGFRAADPRQLLAFGEQYPAHRTIVLGRNFRSRSEILDAAAACVVHNAARQPKALIAMRGGGGQVQVRRFADDRHEAQWIAQLVADALADGMSGEDVLILARTGYASQAVQRALAQAGVAHRVLGSLGLYERAEVKDALAYLALVANGADAQAFRRAIGAPRRGVGDHTATQILAIARDRHDGDLIAASADAAQLDAIRSERTRDQVSRFGQELEAVRSDLAAGRSVGHAAVGAMTIAGGLVAYHQQRRDTSPHPEQRRDAERVLEDLRSLCRAAQAYAEADSGPATLTGFLEHAAGLHAQTLAAGEVDRRVTVSTIHCSPPDEMIATKRGQVPIADLRSDDRLISYHRHTNTVFGNSSHGRAHGYAFRRSVREFDGDLVVIETDRSRTRVTPNHRVLARFDAETFCDRWAVYLMRRGNWWRVGVCTTLRRPYVSGSLNGRLATEKADEGWLLSVHDTRHEAIVAEAMIQASYGLPGLSFQANKGKRLTSRDLACIHDAASPSVAPRAQQLLSDNGLLFDAPLYRRGPDRPNLRGYFVTEAANLVALSGRVEVLTLATGEKGIGRRARVSTERYRGPVYGLDVPPHHYYVSGGAVVHNSAKGTEALLVVLAACEEGHLPSWRASTDAELAEERRLFYVAATRAKDRLVITHAANRNHRDTRGPSRFLSEARLPRDTQRYDTQALAA